MLIIDNALLSDFARIRCEEGHETKRK